MMDSDLAPALAIRSGAVTGILCVSVGCAHPLQQMLGSDHWVVLTSQELPSYVLRQLYHQQCMKASPQLPVT